MSTSNPAPVSADRLNETRAPQALVAIVLCPTLALICVALRLYTRTFLLKKVFWEDYTIVVAMVISIMMSVFMVLAFTTGSGRHIEAVSREQMVFQSKISPGVHINYVATHMSLKLSIALHYTRVSVMPFEKRLCYALVALVLGGYTAVLVVQFIRCIPFYAIWTPNVPGAKCLDTTASFLAVQAHTLAMDFIILLVPLVILRHLNIPWRQKVVLVIVLGFGGMACVVSVIRLQYLRLSATSPDRTWDSYFSAVYGVIEPNVGIICACIVTLRPLFRRWKWLQSGEIESSHVELPGQPRMRHGIHGSGQVLTTHDDDEDGQRTRHSFHLATESKKDLVLTSSVTVEKDDTAESTAAGSRSSEGRHEMDIKSAV
ncbi:hypothetical protein V8F06_004265 [Rhypophila decipiens]